MKFGDVSHCTPVMPVSFLVRGQHLIQDRFRKCGILRDYSGDRLRLMDMIARSEEDGGRQGGDHGRPRAVRQPAHYTVFRIAVPTVKKLK